MVLLTRKLKLQNYGWKKKSIFIFFPFKIIDASIKTAINRPVLVFLFHYFQLENNEKPGKMNVRSFIDAAGRANDHVFISCKNKEKIWTILKERFSSDAGLLLADGKKSCISHLDKV